MMSMSRINQIHLYLQDALNNHEIIPAFQPKISTKDCTIMGFETLARWNHPILGQVSPEEFIPLAEQNHMIIPIGYFMFDQACKRCKELINMGFPDLVFSVNISKIQVQNPKMIHQLIAILHKYNLDPKHIELEITENYFKDNPGNDIDIFQELKSHGIALALDDFGTGISSFEYLRCLSVDTLKIDKSFISDIGINPNVDPIIKCIIQMSHELNMNVVAEGVETLGQANFLINLGCDILQGYFYGRPVSFHEILTML